eukprot:2046510-Alexandrium_andersonii.AAC.1
MAAWLGAQPELPQARLAACAMLLQFDTYLRPGELLSLAHAAVTQPDRAARYKHWAITIAPA